ncbi:MAG TPA: T9SS type A sorting domain-containing protein [Bacteroidia bacterium]|nr:T9SS type A sorting domain-containing protein [Bacteroidia bacterium]
MKTILIIMFISVLLFIAGKIPEKLSGVKSTNGYVGSKTCLNCHQNSIGSIPSMNGWKRTFHAASMTRAFGDSSLSFLYGIRADANNNGIDDFKDNLDLATQTAWASYGVNAPKLSFENAKYYVTIGEVKYEVLLKQGVYIRQNFKAKIPIGGNMSGVITKTLYTLPLTYVIATREWKPFDASLWYDGITPKINNTTTLDDVKNFTRTFDKSCAGCHVTGVGLDTTSTGELISKAATGSALPDSISYDLDGDGQYDDITIGCENCHGPGGPPSHSLYGLPGLGIQNPNLLPNKERKAELCGQCHSRGSAVGSFAGRTLSYPHSDTSFYKPGYVLSEHFNFTTNQQYYWLSEGDSVNQSIGISLRNRQQYLDYAGTFTSRVSKHFQNGITCWNCHDPHNYNFPSQLKAPVDDNTLCLQCHSQATYQNVAHTHHVIDPLNTGRSRCVSCHMAEMQVNSINFDRTEHTFKTIPPEKTIILKNVNNSSAGVKGLPNTCAISCHRAIENSSTPIFNTGYDSSITDWGENSDIALANTLKNYYGPSGLWWNTTTGITFDPALIATSYELKQNYPNPFNPETKISFSIPKEEFVTLKVYDITGQEISTLMNQKVVSGNYTVSFDGSYLASGIYFYRIQTKNYVQAKKMILLK